MKLEHASITGNKNKRDVSYLIWPSDLWAPLHITEKLREQEKISMSSIRIEQTGSFLFNK